MKFGRQFGCASQPGSSYRREQGLICVIELYVRTCGHPVSTFSVDGVLQLVEAEGENGGPGEGNNLVTVDDGGSASYDAADEAEDEDEDGSGDEDEELSASSSTGSMNCGTSGGPTPSAGLANVETGKKTFSSPPGPGIRPVPSPMSHAHLFITFYRFNSPVQPFLSVYSPTHPCAFCYKQHLKR